MMDHNRGEHIFGTSALFITMTLVASTMLLSALLIYIAEVIGSLIGALLILGAVAAIIAIMLYVCWLRPHFIAIREEVTSIYEMAHLARCGYDWVIKRIELFLKNL